MKISIPLPYSQRLHARGHKLPAHVTRKFLLSMRHRRISQNILIRSTCSGISLIVLEVNGVHALNS